MLELIYAAVVLWAFWYLYDQLIKPRLLEAEIARKQKQFLDDTEPRNPALPSTPEETLRATENLRVAHAMLLDFNNQKNNQAQLAQLAEMSKRLRIARSLDPHATLEGRSQDDFAGEALYLESVLYENQAHASKMNWINNISPDRAKNARSKIHAQDETVELITAFTAIDRALRYQPNNVIYLCQAAKVRTVQGQPAEAKQYIDRAYQLDPTNINVLKLR